MQWCVKTLHATQIVVLSSADAAFRKIDEEERRNAMQDGPQNIYHLTTASTRVTALPSDLKMIPMQSDALHVDALPGSTAYLRYLFRAHRDLYAKETRLDGILTFVYPGHDNLAEATTLANVLWRVLPPYDVKGPIKSAEWITPPSWQLLYGQPFDPSLYQ